VPELKIPKEALVQHFIPDKYARKFVRGQMLDTDELEDFLKQREELIAQRAASLLGI